MIKAIFFDLDGTLLPMDEDEFTKLYFKLLCKKLVPYGFNPEELINIIWTGTKAMIKNDGSKTNEELFWDIFVDHYGKESLKNKSEFDEFYVNEFKETSLVCKQNPLAKEIVRVAKSKGLKTILATNPIFPKEGILTRLSFVSLSADDFDQITSYEFSHYSKPNTKYYLELLQNNNLKPEEVVMFGNSEMEDYVPANSVGIKTYLIKGCGEKGSDKVSRVTFSEAIEIINNIK